MLCFRKGTNETATSVIQHEEEDALMPPPVRAGATGTITEEDEEEGDAAKKSKVSQPVSKVRALLDSAISTVSHILNVVPLTDSSCLPVCLAH